MCEAGDLGHQACRDGFRALYFFAPKLFRALKNAQADGSIIKLLKKIARADLLIIDDIGIEPAAPRQYRDLLEILDDRNGAGATIVTGQHAVGEWHQIINDPTVADAVLDRLVHNAYRLEFEGESMRKQKVRAKR